jgi:hypothetical protein
MHPHEPTAVLQRDHGVERIPVRLSASEHGTDLVDDAAHGEDQLLTLEFVHVCGHGDTVRTRQSRWKTPVSRIGDEDGARPIDHS